MTTGAMETDMDERLGARPPTSATSAPPTYVGRTNGKAIASLVLGIVGLTGIPFVCSILALVLGYGARREIVVTGEEGGGLATAGIVLGWVGVALVLLAVLLVLAFIGTNVISVGG